MGERWEGEEFFIDVPSHKLKRKIGFGIDFGGTLIKVVYSKDHGEFVRIHCLRYASDRMREGFTEVAARINEDFVPGQKVFTCGLGCNEHAEYIQDVLKCKIVNVMETDCCVDGFQFLERALPFDDIVVPESKTITAYATRMAESFGKAQLSLATTYRDSCRGEMWESSVKMFAEDKAGDATSEKKTRKVIYPTCLMLGGSAASPQKVGEDGSIMCLDVISTSGKTLLALGSLLTGAKTFEDLMRLAERGNLDNLDITGRFLKTQSADVYASLSSEFTAFSFGQVVGKDLAEVPKEDLALGVISMVIQTLVDSYHNWALITGVKQVYFCGGIQATHPLVMEMMGKCFAYKSKMNPLGKETEHYFVKHGTYLGAIGALLRTLNSEHGIC